MCADVHVIVNAPPHCTQVCLVKSQWTGLSGTGRRGVLLGLFPLGSLKKINPSWKTTIGNLVARYIEFRHTSLASDVWHPSQGL